MGKKEKIINAMVEYLENVPDGTNTTIAGAFGHLFPGESDMKGGIKGLGSMAMFEVCNGVWEKIRLNDKVFFDNLHHWGKVEGLPFNLDFYVRIKKKEESYIPYIPENFMSYILYGQELVGEISFHFETDGIERYIGYSERNKVYWAGLCDVPDGTEFKTPEKLLDAPIYNGKSLRDRWDEITWDSIDGLSPEDWIENELIRSEA